jgi:hypothetical protein
MRTAVHKALSHVNVATFSLILLLSRPVQPESFSKALQIFSSANDL